jgi:hypothetical protein
MCPRVQSPDAPNQHLVCLALTCCRPHDAGLEGVVLVLVVLLQPLDQDLLAAGRLEAALLQFGLDVGQVPVGVILLLLLVIVVAVVVLLLLLGVIGDQPRERASLTSWLRDRSE